MKKICLLIILGMVFTTLCFSQNNSFKYQAVLRDNDGNTINNEQVDIRISILQSSINGSPVYSENHSVTTNNNGLIFINIGNGEIITGNFNSIDWGSSNHFLQIELNRNNTGYISLGVAPLLSVPYALHAQTVANNEDADADPENEIQTLTISNDTIYLSNGGAIKLPNLVTGFSGSYNDLEDIPANLDTDSTDDFSGRYNDLTDVPVNIDTDSSDDFSGDYNDLSNLPPHIDTDSTNDFSGNFNDLTNKPIMGGDISGDFNSITVNKIKGQEISASSPSTGQVLKWTGSAWTAGTDATVSGGGVDGVVEAISVTGTNTKTITLGLSSDAASSNLTAEFIDEVNDADADVTNEIQDLSLNGNILTITNNGTATEIDLSTYLDNTDTQLSESQVDEFVANNGYQLSIVDKDTSPTNELQSLSIFGDTISLTQGGKVTLPTKGWGGLTDDALFAVVNTLGDTVFAVYESGVRIYVDDSKSKAARGGFAVATRSAAKGTELDILNVSTDSVRIYLEENTGKAARGGFAVATRSAAKGTVIGDILSVSDDSVRIYLEESSGKAARGGFAVATRSAAKGTVTGDILSVSDDSVRIYLEESSGKAARGGFAVATRSAAKGIVTGDILSVSDDSVRIYLEEDTGKAARGGFAVATRSAAKGNVSHVMKVTEDSTRIYVNNADAGFGVENTSSGKNERLMRLIEENYFIGHQTGVSNISGLYNTFLGYQSGLAHETGNNNIFIGYQSAYSNKNGNQNIFIGNKTGYKNLSGSRNTFIGDSTGYNNTTGNSHVFIGHNAGFSNTTGSENTFVGYNSGKQNTSGHANAFIGTSAGFSNIDGEFNVFLGPSAGYSLIGKSDTNALYTGSYNAFLGSYAGYNTTVGFANVFIGPYAGYKNTSGRENVFIGLHAGRENTEGYYNTFVGKTSGYHNTTGNVNTFLGFDAGLYNSTGTGNTFLGASSGTFTTTGSDNAFFGGGSGYKNTTGVNNTYLGSNAGFNNTAGDSNIFIGNSAGFNATSSNTLYIDNSGTDLPLIYGNFTDGLEQVEVNGNLVSNGNFWVNGTAGGIASWNDFSDKRLKKNITTIPNALNRVKQLRGVNYEWKDSLHPESGVVKMGFIAQEAVEIIPEVVNKNGEHYSMQYASITAILVEAIKEQQKIIEKQNKKNQELESKLELILKRLEKLEEK